MITKLGNSFILNQRIIKFLWLLVICQISLALAQGVTSSTKNGVKVQAPNVKPATSIPAPPLKVGVTTEAKWIQASLDRHNYYRSLHRSQPLTLNNTLSEISQAYANYMLDRAIESFEMDNRVDYFEHNLQVLRTHGLGENLYFVLAYYDKINASLAVNLWYNEVKDYDFKTAKVKSTSHPSSLIGHFTQLVWNGTNQMGTAYAAHKLKNDQTITFVVANYHPAGNAQYYGNYPMKLYFTNVLPEISDAENEIELDGSQIIREDVLRWEIPKASLTTPKIWIEGSVDQHNKYRRASQVPDIVVSEELCEVAQAWANKLLEDGVSDFNKYFMVTRATTGNFNAVERAKFGENLLYFIGDGLVDTSFPVKAWFEEKQFYDFEHRKTNKTISTTARTEHFEQVVWKSTTHMGTAFASGTLENGQILTFVVANYYPRWDKKSLEERMENVPYENNAFYTYFEQLMILILSR